MIAVNMFLKGVTEADYDKVHALVTKDGAPAGLILHVSGAADGGWQINDLWETREAFETFGTKVLQPKLEGIVTAQPEIEITELHDAWVPGVAKLSATPKTLATV